MSKLVLAGLFIALAAPSSAVQWDACYRTLTNALDEEANLALGDLIGLASEVENSDQTEPEVRKSISDKRQAFLQAGAALVDEIADYCDAQRESLR